MKRRKITKFTKITHLSYVILMLAITIAVLIASPTLARYKNRVSIVDAAVWDGTTSSTYSGGSGTSNDPYLILTGADLSYFADELLSTDYQNAYFVLGNDIIINEGVFDYDDTNKIQYILNSTTYYVDSTTNKYYDNSSYSGTEIGTLLTLDSFDGFKGNFNGSSYTIYGFYKADTTNEEVALFTDLNGTIENLYLENTMIYGGTITGGLASKATSTTITNVLFDGFVIGQDTSLSKTENISITTSPISMTNVETTEYINLSNNIPFEGAEITSTSITGSYVISEQGVSTVKINGELVSGGTFDVDLGITILDEVSIATYIDLPAGATLTLSSVEYNVTYNYATAGGVIAFANNVTMNNIISKADVYGYSTAGGMIGVSNNTLSITQGYSETDITSDYIAGGLIGTLEKSANNITITKAYNKGDMSATDFGGLIGKIINNSGSVTISNSFNTSTTNYTIGTIADTSVTISSSYYVNGASSIYSGSATGSFTQTTLANLQDKTFVVTNLDYDEFIDFDDLLSNPGNAWVYEEGELPILFNDDINNPFVNININDYAWNNLSYELSNLYFATSIGFTIDDVNVLDPAKEKYYFISNSATPLTSTEISNISSWTSYSSEVTISTEGEYVVYAKIVDYDDEITYIDSDVLIVDLTGPNTTLILNDNEWTDLRSSLENIYINQDKNLTITATDTYSEVDTKEYYITDQILNETELDALSSESWTTYDTNITLDALGEYIIYIKTTDDLGNYTYVNSDYIIYDGYDVTLTLGKNQESYTGNDLYITDLSSINLKVTYLNNDSTELTSHTHNLISTILLPLGTTLTLIDNMTDSVYEYEITTSNDIYGYADSCSGEGPECVSYATYPLTLFNDIGTDTTINNYPESTYYNAGTTEEAFEVILDFSNTTMSSNYEDINLYFELRDATSEVVRPTLQSEIENLNIYYDLTGVSPDATYDLTTTYEGTLYYNADDETAISITSDIIYQTIGEYSITDTTNEDKKIGLAIWLEDDQSNVIEQDYLKNITFKIGENYYYPEQDGIVRAYFGDAKADIVGDLTIITYANNSDLEDGTYYLKISNFISEDGKYYSNLLDNELSITMEVENTNPTDLHQFDVIMDDEDRIINMEDETNNIAFSILYNGELETPNIVVSLYAKSLLTAYDQTYSLVDLQTFVTDTLTPVDTFKYQAISTPQVYEDPDYLYNNFELNLDPTTFDNLSYKYVFELYDDDKLIDTITKSFIAK